MTDQEFYKKVMGYTGQYPSKELLRFYIYYTQKKHFSTIKSFTLGRRLATWFSTKRKQKFTEKNNKRMEGQTQEEIRASYLKNLIGKVNPKL